MILIINPCLSHLVGAALRAVRRAWKVSLVDALVGARVGVERSKRLGRGCCGGGRRRLMVLVRNVLTASEVGLVLAHVLLARSLVYRHPWPQLVVVHGV